MAKVGRFSVNATSDMDKYDLAFSSGSEKAVPLLKTESISFSARSNSINLTSDLILLFTVGVVSSGRVLPVGEGAEPFGLPVTEERLVGGRFRGGGAVDLDATVERLQLATKTRMEYL